MAWGKPQGKLRARVRLQGAQRMRGHLQGVWLAWKMLLGTRGCGLSHQQTRGHSCMHLAAYSSVQGCVRLGSILVHNCARQG